MAKTEDDSELDEVVAMDLGVVGNGQEGLPDVLLKIMRTDPDTNVVMGNIPPGEAEEYAAMVTFAEAIGSPVMLRYANLCMMAKRAEKGNLLNRILDAVKAIGSGGTESGGIFSRFRR